MEDAIKPRVSSTKNLPALTLEKNKIHGLEKAVMRIPYPPRIVLGF